MVLDEFGGIIGLITMDDLLGTIFGSLTPIPEMTETAEVNEDGKKVLKVKGDISVRDFNKKMGTFIPTDIAETMGGWLLHKFGELPAQGAAISFEDVEYTAAKVVNNRIAKIECHRKGADKKSDKKKNEEKG